MIYKAELINQPYSGEYEESVYDISSPWNSQDWTWVKFVNKDLTEWCGNFRGSPRGVAVSIKYSSVLVLTSDYLFKLDCLSGKITEYESQPQYQCLTVTPTGDFIAADYYSIEMIESTLDSKIQVHSPIEMDHIRFHGWINNKLLITCDEFLNWDNHLELELDGGTLEITLKDTSK